MNALKRIPSKESEYTCLDGEQRNIHSVERVVKATYGAHKYGNNNIFNKNEVTDVTEKIKTLLSSEGVLRLESVNLTKFTGAGKRWPSQWLAGTKRELKVWYKEIGVEPEPDHMLPTVKALVSKLEKGGLLKEMHRNDGEYTWFKLSEWMQVEIVKIFGESMTHKPFYTFEFMEFMRVYIEVLFKECMIVLKKHGAQKAFLSMAFFTDAVPAVAMSLLFAQMELMSWPLRNVLGDDYSDAADRKEQIVIQVAESAVNWGSVDDRIEPQPIVQGLYTLDVPTFKPMTEVILNIADRVPTARILQISNNDEVQVRVSVEPAEKERSIRAIEELPGTDVMFDYKFPTDGKQAVPSRTQISLCVQIPYLLNTVRCLRKKGVEVEQIYDWWI